VAYADSIRDCTPNLLQLLSALRDIGIHLNPHHASELASPAGLRDALGAGIGTPLKVRNAILRVVAAAGVGHPPASPLLRGAGSHPLWLSTSWSHGDADTRHSFTLCWTPA
jgi:hypothetical protein